MTPNLDIPNELIEAARVDGASYFRIFWEVMLPLIRPALLAVAVLEFLIRLDVLVPTGRPRLPNGSVSLGSTSA